MENTYLSAMSLAYVALCGLGPQESLEASFVPKEGKKKQSEKKWKDSVRDREQ